MPVASFQLALGVRLDRFREPETVAFGKYACRLEALRRECPHRGILGGVISSRRSVPASPRPPTPFAVDDQAPAAGAEHAAHLAETLASLGSSEVGEDVSHDR